MRQEKTSALNVSLAFFGGALLGAGTALLFAPRSGEETRDSLGQIASQAREAVGGMVHWGREAVEGSENQAPQVGGNQGA